MSMLKVSVNLFLREVDGAEHSVRLLPNQLEFPNCVFWSKACQRLEI